MIVFIEDSPNSRYLQSVAFVLEQRLFLFLLFLPFSFYPKNMTSSFPFRYFFYHKLVTRYKYLDEKLKMITRCRVLQSSDRLLWCGGDDRQTPDESPEKLNRYYCSCLPRTDIIRRASCTSSTVNSSDFLIAEKCRLDFLGSLLEKDTTAACEVAFDASFQKVICRLKALFQCSGEIVLFPSGSDAEYISVLLALMQSREFAMGESENIKVFNNVVAAGEVSSYCNPVFTEVV